MIRNFIRLFVPDKIKNYIILPLKSVGLCINSDSITATVILAKGKKIYIEKTIHFDLLKDQESMTDKIS